MGNLLEFKTRAEYQRLEVEYKRLEVAEVAEIVQPVIESTVMELFNQLYIFSLENLKEMMITFKNTGRWNPIADKLMERVCEDVKAICASVAGENNEHPSNRPTEEAQRQTPEGSD